MTEQRDDLDRALQSLTDASPSPAVRANVMRRIAEERAPKIRGSRLWDPAFLRLRSGQAAGFAAGFRVRVALATVGVVLVAVASWFALKHQPPQNIASQRRPSHDVALPVPSNAPSEQTSHAVSVPGAGTTRQAMSTPGRLAGRVKRDLGSMENVETEPALEPVNELPPAVSPIDLTPIPDPAPVTMTPVMMKPLEIPDIQIPPVDDQSDRTTTPAKDDPGKKPPSGAAGVNR